MAVVKRSHSARTRSEEPYSGKTNSRQIYGCNPYGRFVCFAQLEQSGKPAQGRWSVKLMMSPAIRFPPVKQRWKVTQGKTHDETH